MDERLAHTPEPPYYAVIFSSARRGSEDDGYAETASRMAELAREQPGFLGMESVRGADGMGITVSYWSSPEAIEAWRNHAEHRVAQRMGPGRWYASYRIRVARVERDRMFESDQAESEAPS